MEKAWKEDKLGAFQSKFRNVDLIILDEMGYVLFTTEGAELFFQNFTGDSFRITHALSRNN
ncbi:DNA replication protein DnaC [Gracilibacillus alcaliphilus]|nr:DNA replication protein DnaC [Gracilibacillus alcaliphilus]